MRHLILNKKYLLLYCVSIAFLSHAQNGKPFEQQEKFYINGNSIVIGNNIIGAHKLRPFTDLNVLNDDLKMTYIDIDKDRSTFSSSAADIEIKENSKIIYAGLYWAGTYAGEKGTKSTQKQQAPVYSVSKGRDKDFNQVKIKSLNEDYQVVQGTTVFDAGASNNNAIKEHMTYVSKANVTDFFNGKVGKHRIVVADIVATQGYIDNGSAAGWMLFIVYENDQEDPVYITTYDGFEFINEENASVAINDFQVVQDFDSVTKVTLTALEGDGLSQSDLVQLTNPDNDLTQILKSEQRSEDNFFNSTINVKNGFNSTRCPENDNTLGFDIAQVEVENKTLNFSSDQANRVRLTYASKSDHYYTFFAAFQTQISPDFLAIKKQELKNGSLDAPLKPKWAVITNENNRHLNNDKVVTTYKAQDSTKNLDTTTNDQDVFMSNSAVVVVEEDQVEVVEKQKQAATTVTTYTAGPVSYTSSTTVSSQNVSETATYYVITHVFDKPQNAVKWRKVLQELGYQPYTWVHPDNGWEYIYIASSQDKESLLPIYHKARNNELLTNTWIRKMD